MPREFLEEEQRNRVLQAALEVFGTKGYAPATVQDLIAAARISRETFYKLFTDKEGALLALQDEVLGWLEEEAREAASAAGDWPGRVLAVSGRLLGLLAVDPRLARLCCIETPLAGPAAAARHSEAMDALGAALARGREERPWGPELPGSLERLLLWGAVSLAGRRVLHGTEDEALDLAVEVPEILLIPYLGIEDARIRARGST